MWQQQDVRSLQRENSGNFWKLIVVADDRPDFAEAKIVHHDLTSTFVIEGFIPRHVYLALLPNIAVWPNQKLSVEDDVSWFFGNPNGQNESVLFCHLDTSLNT